MVFFRYGLSELVPETISVVVLLQQKFRGNWLGDDGCCITGTVWFRREVE